MHTSGPKGRDDSHSPYTGDKSPAYRPKESFRSL